MFVTVILANSSNLMAQTSVLHLIPHFHYDVAWLETEDSYGAKGADLIHQYLATAKNDPGYKFVLDQVPLLKYFFRYYPNEIQYLQQLIAEGRCEIFGSLNVQGDEDLVIGESLVRQIIYGQKWYEENLNTRGSGAWNIDDFGHALQMPQVLARSGLKFCAFARGGDLTTRPKYSEFYWMAPDGSKILTHWMPAHYNASSDVGNQENDNTDIQATINKLKASSLTGHMFSLNGDDMTPPRLFLSQAIKNWNSTNADIQLRNSTPSDFFNAVLAKGTAIPQLGPMEFQREFTGCYSSRIDIKQRNRKIEHLMLTSEKISAMASIEGMSFPTDLFNENGADFLINQMHDILPGSAIDPVYIDATARFNRCENAFNRALDNALNNLLSKVNTQPLTGAAAKPLVVFNQLNWARHEILIIPYDAVALPYPFIVTDNTGKEITYQIIGNNYIAFLVDVPSFGYTTYFFQKGITPKVSAIETKQAAINPVLENSDYSVSFNSSGEISSLKDKTITNKDWFRGAIHKANQLTVRADNGNSWEYKRGSEAGSTANFQQAIEIFKGPVVQRTVITGAIPSSSVVHREVRIYEGFRRIDFLTDFNWQGTWNYVFVSFPFNTGTKRVDGVPYGSIERPVGQYPVCMWSDMGTGQEGITLLNKGLPDYEVTADGGNITLLRSHGGPNGNSVDHYMKGFQSFEYSLFPHTGSHIAAGSAQRGWEYNSPLVYRWAENHTGTLASSKSYLTADSTAILSVFNQDDYGYQMRFFNPYNSAIPDYKIKLNASGILKIEETNLMGASSADLSGGSNSLTSFKAMEIKSVRGVLTSPEGSRLIIIPDTAIYLNQGQKGWITIKAVSPSGKLAYSSSGKVRLSSGSASMSFSIDGTNWSNSLDAVLNMGIVKIFLRDTVSGSSEVTATDLSGKLTPVNKSNLFILGYDHLSFIPVDSVLAPLSAECPVTLESRDQRNLRFTGSEVLLVKLKSTKSSLLFSTVNGSWQKELIANISDGQLKFRIRDTVEGKASIVATCVSNPEIKQVSLQNIYTCKNLAQLKTVTADGETNSNERAAYAVDGSLKTKWCSASTEPHWLQVDFGAVTKLDYFVVKHAGAKQAPLGDPGYDDVSAMNTTSFQIQTSGSVLGPWKTIVNVDKNPSTAQGDVTYHHLAEPVNTRFVRLYITDAGQDAATRIYEFEAYYLGSVALSGEDKTLPKNYFLLQNYPNPFNPNTVIGYELPVKVHVSLSVFDILGREVAALVNEEQQPGIYSANFNASSLTSGVYFYKLKAGGFSASGKMLLLK